MWRADLKKKKKRGGEGFPSEVCTAGTRRCGYGGCLYDALGYGDRKHGKQSLAQKQCRARDAVIISGWVSLGKVGYRVVKEESARVRLELGGSNSCLHLLFKVVKIQLSTPY